MALCLRAAVLVALGLLRILLAVLAAAFAGFLGMIFTSLVVSGDFQVPSLLSARLSPFLKGTFRGIENPRVRILG